MSNLKALLHSNTKPVCARTKRVLVIGGLDPTGAAGVVADISTLARVNTRPAVLLSTQTAQGLSRWGQAQPVEASFFRAQARLLLEGPPWDAIKVGAVGSADIAAEIFTLLQQLRAQNPELPIVIDPVLQSSSGGILAQPSWLDRLLPLATVCCPNRDEHAVLAARSAHVGQNTLITDQPPGAVLYPAEAEPVHYTYTRARENWRGTGCRLSSLLAAALASGLPIDDSCGWALATLQAWLHDASTAPAPTTAHLFP